MNSGSSSHLRVDSIYQRINSVISFVAENPVRAIASHTQVWLSRWYKDVSSFFPFLSCFFEICLIIPSLLRSLLHQVTLLLVERCLVRLGTQS
jgi:hypothetical protein